MQPRVGLVVVQPTPFCNIDCRYCYLPTRNARDVIGDGTLVNLFEKLWQSGWVRRDVHVVWHAGEPTVLPPSFYRRAFALADSGRPNDVALTHSFQTNAALLNEEWCDLIERHRVRVGVSIDGPEWLLALDVAPRDLRQPRVDRLRGVLETAFGKDDQRVDGEHSSAISCTRTTPSSRDGRRPRSSTASAAICSASALGARWRRKPSRRRFR